MMTSAADVAGIIDNSKELDRLREEQEELLLQINKMHKKLQSSPAVVQKPGDNSLSTLKLLYTQAKELSEKEVRISNKLLGQLDALMPSGTAGQQRKRIGSIKRRKADSNGTKLSPSLRNQLDSLENLKGEHVAGRVIQDGKDEWLVVKVLNFDRETRLFDVLDEEPGDEEENNGPRQYKLPISHVIPFPKPNDPSTAIDFPRGKYVLAVYPETTALYKATVVQAHKRKTDDYILEFDDDEENGFLPQRSVPFHKVVPLPEGHLQ